MPACAPESVGKLWSPVTIRSGGSTPPSPSSPVSCSPPPRPLYRSSSSTFTLLDRRYLTPSPPPREIDDGLLVRLIGWYPCFCVRFLRNLATTLVYLVWTQVLLIGPTLWLSAWLWIFWKCVRLPLSLAKWALTVMFTTAAERSRKKRTVLISGGSTVQALHLARNFYSAGARVVVFEIEGLFGLARFSTAVHKFYTVPRPSGDRAEEYVEAIKRIAAAEKAGYFIPVSATTTAYYDALAKPHLELLGCTCFCPGLKEICVLDDASELLRRCQAEGMSVPVHYPVMCKEEVYRLYDDGSLSSGRHIMMNVGPLGCRDRMKVLLPNVKREFRPPHYISLQRPWVIVRDYPGDHFVTCTTVKDSKVIANVTCRVENSHGHLVPIEHEEIEIWLNQLFSRLKFMRPVSGHMSFRFVESTNSGSIVPLGCKVGVSLAYICHTNVHNPSVESVTKLIGTVLDRREALFAYWDPLPYCAYYHLQLPFNRVLRFVNEFNGRPGFDTRALAPAH
ncbi:hypothetical protein AAG570_002184 [Ranatra chinensis]|uniref:Uncharacterized protein n=1 Tax=Ranatra chinensis TaxID=642074 RepID=A0ABD0Y7A2_9HEMI